MTKQQLIEENMNLVYYIINKYYPAHINDDDIIQAGMVGLCTAADKWCEDKSKFSTYAGRLIKGHILMEFRYRTRHAKTLSLDYEYESAFKDGERTTLGDTIAGEEDVNFDYTEDFYKQLSPRQSEIIELCKTGLSISEIARQFGVKRQAIWGVLRVVKRKWNKYNGQVNRK